MLRLIFRLLWTVARVAIKLAFWLLMAACVKYYIDRTISTRLADPPESPFFRDDYCKDQDRSNDPLCPSRRNLMDTLLRIGQASKG